MFCPRRRRREGKWRGRSSGRWMGCLPAASSHPRASSSSTEPPSIRCSSFPLFFFFFYIINRVSSVSPWMSNAIRGQSLSVLIRSCCPTYAMFLKRMLRRCWRHEKKKKKKHFSRRRRRRRQREQPLSALSMASRPSSSSYRRRRRSRCCTAHSFIRRLMVVS